MQILRELGIDPIAEYVPVPTLGYLFVERLDVRHTAAENDHRRVQNIDHHGEAGGQALDISVKCGNCVGFTHLSGGADFGRGRRYACNSQVIS